MIQYLLIENRDGTMTVVKVANEKQIASYKITMDVPTLDMLLETFVITQIPTSHGMNIAYGEEREIGE